MIKQTEDEQDQSIYTCSYTMRVNINGKYIVKKINKQERNVYTTIVTLTHAGLVSEW